MRCATFNRRMEIVMKISTKGRYALKLMLDIAKVVKHFAAFAYQTYQSALGYLIFLVLFHQLGDVR